MGDVPLKKEILLIVKDYFEKNHKSVIPVIITSLLKKILSPDQDIRYHQESMSGGYSGRTMDTRSVTPFLREHGFPYMQSGSGWLTRSFEQARPYTHDYAGRITPKIVKNAFLTIMDVTQSGVDPRNSLMYLFSLLIDYREKTQSPNLALPTGQRIEEIVRLIERHWKSNHSQRSQLPVIALYAVYRCLMGEVCKYKNWTLLDLESHTSADSKTSRWGDIDITDNLGRTVESVEVKYGTEITHALIKKLQDKIATSGLQTFYVLSTNEKIRPQELSPITETIIEIRRKYGCQVIINGVASTIRYYLRLLKNPDVFVREYVHLLESNSDIPYTLKKEWNEIVG